MSNSNLRNCILNKLFAGSYIDSNLGHELINFIKDDEGNGYIYTMPHGKPSERAKNSDYVFQIVKANVVGEKNIYELVSVVEIDHEKSSNLINSEFVPQIKGNPFKDIFYNGEGLNKAEDFTFVRGNFYVPIKRVYIKVQKEEAKIERLGEMIIVSVSANPQHHLAYAENKDYDVLVSLINDMKKCDVNLVNDDPKTIFENASADFHNSLSEHLNKFNKKLKSLQ